MKRLLLALGMALAPLSAYAGDVTITSGGGGDVTISAPTGAGTGDVLSSGTNTLTGTNTFTATSASPIKIKPGSAPAVDTKLLDLQATGAGTTNFSVDAEGDATANSLTLTTPLAIGQGGTGATDAATARTNLGLGTLATQVASSVAITGGSITGITDLAVADGGTGASDAATARTNLGIGGIATQAANTVAITGGAIDGTTLGATIASTGKFTTLRGGDATNYTDISTAGALTYAGSARPNRTVILTAAGAITATSSSGADVRRTDGTNFSYYTANFSDGSTQAANWQFVVPDSFDASVTTVSVTLYWMTGVTTGGVVWKAETDGKPVNGATAFDSALQTAQTQRFAVNGTANALATSTFSTAPTSGWAPGEVAVVKVSRVGGDTTTGGTGDDVANGTTAKLVMVKIEWSANAESD